MRMELWTVKIMLMQFQIEVGIKLEIELKSILVIAWQRTWMHCVHALRLWKAELKNDGLSQLLGG
jgi:hypothetical protein